MAMGIGLEVYRLLRDGQVDEALARVRAHVAREGGAGAFYEVDRHGDSAFDLWSEIGNATLLAELETLGVPWDLRSAARWGRVVVLERLLDEAGDGVGAALAARDRRGFSALDNALACGQLEAARRLLARDPLALDDPRSHAVWAALRARAAEVLEFAFAHGARADAGPSSRTALHHECNHGRTKLVPVLLAAGADPEARDADDHDRSALHMAAQRGNMARLCGVLVAAGARLDAVDARGETALDIARRARGDGAARWLRREQAREGLLAAIRADDTAALDAILDGEAGLLDERFSRPGHVDVTPLCYAVTRARGRAARRLL
ncbi:MAG: ankyrin repeat domain-containing protein, partial [Myxococcales bacterium]|nr:ankyrin repeat domain-containing protein [Myxococcales bacterium]